ncbi:MAG: DNA mismatch endonuclease Vsr [bacterium]|nr:DNA mismatch endonuclease Vsr [Candidatus Limimorpha caballi]
MSDPLTPEQRHHCMASIHGKDTKPEIVVRKYLWNNGFRYRLNHPRLPGKPDVVLRKYRTCIFINGCFWHGHEGCKSFVMPRSNVDFWKAKIDRNRRRDIEVQLKLADMGWHRITIWECQLKKDRREETLKGLVYTLDCIFLNDHKPKNYSDLGESLPMAAEEQASYGVN